jgi:hypothetical protein
VNIFVLSHDPVLAAQMQCDQHIVKMPLETAQILCSLFPNGSAPYRMTHFNHPCTQWSRDSSANYTWLIEHGLALCDEFEYRYEKVHASKEVIFWCWAHMPEAELYRPFPYDGLTPFKCVMDEKFRLNDIVSSYRNFYVKSKMSFAKWNKKRSQPDWIRP